MHGVFYLEEAITIDARARIPARIGGLIVDLQSYFIFALGLYVLGYVKLKGGVAIFPFACQMPVYKQRAVHINAVKAYKNPLTRCCLGQVKHLFVTAHIAFVQVVYIPYQPIVGHLDGPPCLASFYFKLPAVIKIIGVHGRPPFSIFYHRCKASCQSNIFSI
jgi:hypothetical protein